ncbi:FAD:protein FMN transferase [Shewanella kaireitica]|uniref:FAD:protein FMN transferase n=1 Tax=Shewanella kaireitica TaxID=212021 RepID=UPI00200F8B1B|nr:FAD:protein FMN transferase [Shewanella kaireitica]MCL1092706.1 FAD:protein FMN transferase [Shewanella kaireitica]
MGNTFKVTWTEEKITADRMNKISIDISRKLKAINTSMSTWDANSELSIINKSSQLKNINLSPELASVIQQALVLNKLTEGALDITVAPLIQLWGFGVNGKIVKAPSDTQIAAIKALTGSDKIEVGNGKLQRFSEGVSIDLSSIAKGYAVDAIATLLENNDIKNYIVDIGGELKLKGNKQNNEPWSIGIDKPFAYSSGQIEVITPGDKGIATSGDYRKYFESNGKHYSHIINPTSGKPVQHTVVSATVISDSCMKSDGLATAFMVLPVSKSLEIANNNNLSIMIIEDKFGKLITHHSNNFKQYIN